MKKTVDICEKKTKKELIFELTKSEREEKLEALLSLEKTIENKKCEIKKFRTQIMAEIKESVAERLKLARHLDENAEPRIVDCIARFDYVKALVQFIFKNKVMEQREIWDHERQEVLPLEKKTKKKGKKNGADIASPPSDITSEFGERPLTPASA